MPPTPPRNRLDKPPREIREEPQVVLKEVPRISASAAEGFANLGIAIDEALKNERVQLQGRLVRVLAEYHDNGNITLRMEQRGLPSFVTTWVRDKKKEEAPASEPEPEAKPATESA